MVTHEERQFDAQRMLDIYREMDSADRTYFDQIADRVNATNGEARTTARLEGQRLIERHAKQADGHHGATDRRA